MSPSNERYGKGPDSVWEVWPDKNNGWLRLQGPNAEDGGIEDISRSGARALSEKAFSLGATHVRFNFDLKLIKD